MRLRGVLAVEPARPRALLGPEQRRLLDTCASLLAISLERIHYIEVAQKQHGADRVGAPAQLAAVGDLARPAHAADRAGRPGRHAGADAARRRAPQQREIAGAIRAVGAAHERAGQQPARHGAPGGRRGAAQPRTGSRWRRWWAARWPPARRRWRGRPRATCGWPTTCRCCELDAVLIERVLVNLLENAAKYTPAGSAIEIARARRQRRGDAAPSTTTARACRRGARRRIFEKFERGAQGERHAGRRPRPGDLPRHRAGARRHASAARTASRRPHRRRALHHRRCRAASRRATTAAASADAPSAGRAHDRAAQPAS